MKVLFDTSVILDVLLEREPHAGAAARLFALVDNERLDGAVCATTVTTVTCNARDFSRATLPVFDPDELLAAAIAVSD